MSWVKIDSSYMKLSLPNWDHRYHTFFWPVFFASMSEIKGFMPYTRTPNILYISKNKKNMELN